MAASCSNHTYHPPHQPSLPIGRRTNQKQLNTRQCCQHKIAPDGRKLDSGTTSPSSELYKFSITSSLIHTFSDVNDFLRHKCCGYFVMVTDQIANCFCLPGETAAQLEQCRVPVQRLLKLFLVSKRLLFHIQNENRDLKL